jgi:hypothetical protein
MRRHRAALRNRLCGWRFERNADDTGSGLDRCSGTVVCGIGQPTVSRRLGVTAWKSDSGDGVLLAYGRITREGEGSLIPYTVSGLSVRCYPRWPRFGGPVTVPPQWTERAILASAEIDMNPCRLYQFHDQRMYSDFWWRRRRRQLSAVVKLPATIRRRGAYFSCSLIPTQVYSGTFSAYQVYIFRPFCSVMSPSSWTSGSPSPISS